MKRRKQNMDSKEEPRWLDHPRNVRRIIRGFYFLCAAVVLADLILGIGWGKHAAFEDQSFLADAETLPAFYGAYGFLACVGLVWVSKLMRSWGGKNLLMREEDYWDG